MTTRSSSPSTHRNFSRHIPFSKSDFILIGLAVICALLYALLMSDLLINIFYFIPLLVVSFFYLIKSWHDGSISPLDLPVITLLILSFLGIFFTPFTELFTPKLSGLILGVSIYIVIGTFFRYRQRLSLMIFSLLFLSILIAVLALVAADWPIGNMALFDRVYEHLPSLAGKFGVEKINKNTIGGALTFFPPLLLSLFWDKGAFGRLKSHYHKLSSFPDAVYKSIVFLCFALSLGVLILTQSRGAWLGCVAGIFLLCVLRDKRFLWLLLPLTIVVSFIFLQQANSNLFLMLSLLDTRQEATLPGRMEIWSKALIMLRDFPLTGIGLGTFGEVYRLYFASIVLPSAGDIVYHAHNTLLSVAVEVGLPGVLVYSTLLGSFGAISWDAMKHKRTVNRVLATGLACGVFGYLVFGLFDAFTLGRNLEIVFWIFLGCGSALYKHNKSLSSSEHSFLVYKAENDTIVKNKMTVKQYRKRDASILTSWLVIVLVTLALVNVNVTLALLLAIASGLVLGVRCVRGVEPKKYEQF